MSAENSKPLSSIKISVEPGSSQGNIDSDESPQAVPDKKHKSDKKPIHKTPREIGGPAGLEPTRYGDWEAKGRCYDF